MHSPIAIRLLAISGMALGLLVHAPPAPAQTVAQFQLHFRCSPWLYMREVTDSMRRSWERSRGTSIAMDISTVNARLCTQSAASITYAANVVFASNGIPATFRYTTEVLPGGGGTVTGQKFRVDLFNNYARDKAVDLMNERTPFPDVHVDSTEIVRDVDTSTCSVFSDPTTAPDCNSLVAHTCPQPVTEISLCRNAAGGTVFGRASPFISGHGIRSMNDSINWGASTSAGGPRKINVMIRYAPYAENGAEVLGQARGIYDRASTVLALNTGSLTRRALTPANYLPTVGIITVANSPGSTFHISSAVHEIGHVLGALHERSNMEGTPFYTLAELVHSGSQFAYLNNNAKAPAFDTLMVSTLRADARLNFSTAGQFKINVKNPPLCPPGQRCSPPNPSCPPGKTCTTRLTFSIGDVVTDNRLYVFDTIRWITGDASLVLAAATNPTTNTLSEVIP